MALTGTCHCGATRFEIEIAPESLTECNCTYCGRTGGLWAYCTPDQFKALTAQTDAVYAPREFNKHYFCANCGMTAYNITPVWSLDGSMEPGKLQVSINARLLEDFDLDAVTVEKIDGRHLW